MQDGRQPGLQLTTSHRLSGEGTALAISDKCGTPLLVPTLPPTDVGYHCHPIMLLPLKSWPCCHCSSQPSSESNLHYLASKSRLAVSLDGGARTMSVHPHWEGTWQSKHLASSGSRVGLKVCLPPGSRWGYAPDIGRKFRCYGAKKAWQASTWTSQVAQW